MQARQAHAQSVDQAESGWIAAALKGDVNAFNTLVLRYQDAAYSLAYRLMGDPASAADATQEAFINAFRRLDSYRGGNFRSWLLTITANTCYDELRRQKRRPVTGIDDLPGGDTDDGPPLPANTITPEEAAQDSELSAAIQNCINGLQADYRVTLVMFDVEGYSYQEIAEQSGIQLGTVKSRLSRARLAMRRCLEGVRELLPIEYRQEDNE